MQVASNFTMSSWIEDWDTWLGWRTSVDLMFIKEFFNVYVVLTPDFNKGTWNPATGKWETKTYEISFCDRKGNPLAVSKRVPTSVSLKDSQEWDTEKLLKKAERILRDVTFHNQMIVLK